MVRRVCWLLGTAAAFYMAVIYRSNAFLMLGMAGILFLPFLAGTLLFYGEKLRFSLELPQNAQEQKKEYPIGLHMKDMHMAYIPRVKVKMVLKNQASGARRVLWLKKAEKEEDGVYLERKIKNLDFGMWRVSCRKVYLYDMFGWGRMRRRCKETGSFMILPACHKISIKAGIRIKWFLSDGELYDQDTGGDDPAEIFKLREYRNGDRKNYIHWKLSARNDTLIVKERSMPIGCNVVFFLDMDGSNMKKQQSRSFWEVVYTIGGELLAQECFYYMVWYDRKNQELIRKRVMSEENLYEFWGKISSYPLGSCEWNREYCGTFKGEQYAADIRLNSELKLYCNGSLIEVLKEKELAEQLSELEIIL